jgi:hypothetical protein
VFEIDAAWRRRGVRISANRDLAEALFGTKSVAPRLHEHLPPASSAKITRLTRGKESDMASRATRLGGRILKRVTKPIPIIGTVVVVATAIPILRSKGLMRGGLNIALDAIPLVGSAKGIIELFTGDLIPDRASRAK